MSDGNNSMQIQISDLTNPNLNEEQRDQINFYINRYKISYVSFKKYRVTQLFSLEITDQSFGQFINEVMGE